MNRPSRRAPRPADTQSGDRGHRERSDDYPAPDLDETELDEERTDTELVTSSRARRGRRCSRRPGRRGPGRPTNAAARCRPGAGPRHPRPTSTRRSSTCSAAAARRRSRTADPAGGRRRVDQRQRCRPDRAVAASRYPGLPAEPAYDPDPAHGRAASLGAAPPAGPRRAASRRCASPARPTGPSVDRQRIVSRANRAPADDQPGRPARRADAARRRRPRARRRAPARATTRRTAGAAPAHRAADRRAGWRAPQHPAPAAPARHRRTPADRWPGTHGGGRAALGARARPARRAAADRARAGPAAAPQGARSGASRRRSRSRSSRRRSSSATATRAIELAITEIAGHLTFTPNTVTAWYWLPEVRWAFRPDAEREALLSAISEQYAGLAGFRLHLRRTTRPFPADEWARTRRPAHAARRCADVPGATSWSDHLVAAQRHLLSVNHAEGQTYLGVTFARRSLGDTLVRADAARLRQRRRRRRTAQAGPHGRAVRRGARRVRHARPAGHPARARVAALPLGRAVHGAADHALAGDQRAVGARRPARRSPSRSSATARRTAPRSSWSTG